MKLCNGFEIVNIADENLLVSVGERSKDFHGVVILSGAAAFLLEKLKGSLTIDELVNFLTEKYDVNEEIAYRDIKEMTRTLLKLGVISDESRLEGQ